MAQRWVESAWNTSTSWKRLCGASLLHGLQGSSSKGLLGYSEGPAPMRWPLSSATTQGHNNERGLRWLEGLFALHLLSHCFATDGVAHQKAACSTFLTLGILRAPPLTQDLSPGLCHPFSTLKRNNGHPATHTFTLNGRPGNHGD